MKLYSKLASTNTDIKSKEKNHQDITACSYDMESHDQKRVERNCALAHKTVDQLHKVSTTCFGRPPSKTRRNGNCVRIVRDLLSDCFDLYFFQQEITWQDQSQSGTVRAVYNSHVQKVTLITHPTTDSIVHVGNQAIDCKLWSSKTPILQEL